MLYLGIDVVMLAIIAAVCLVITYAFLHWEDVDNEIIRSIMLIVLTNLAALLAGYCVIAAILDSLA